MKVRAISFFLVLLATLATLPWAFSEQTATAERLSPELDQLIAPDAEIERVATAPGFKWTEGPVWIHAGYLLFAEIPSNSIRKWTPGKGVTIFMQPSGYQGSAPYGGPEPGSNGMTLDARGRLTVAGHAQRDVWRLESLNPVTMNVVLSRASKTFTQNPEITILADTYQSKLLNSPNDLVYNRAGDLYFTDPPYGLPTQSDHDPTKQLPFNGVYRIPHALTQPAGTPARRSELQLLIKDLPRPNGIVFSPDERYLYVNNSEPKKLWMRYAVRPDGSLDSGAVFFDATSDTRPGAPDGMKVDRLGNLYSAGPGGVWIFSPEAKHLGTLLVPERVGNLTWGDDDKKTLYITASTSVYRVRMKVAGVYP